MLDLHRFLLPLALAAGSAATAHAQTWSLTFPTNTHVDAFRAGPGGEAAAAIEEGLAKFDPAGQLVWSRTLQDAFLQVRPAADGTLWAFGYGTARHLDADGNGLERIQVSYGGPGGVNNVLPTQDSGLALTGGAYDDVNSRFFGIVERFEPDGSLRWRKALAHTGTPPGNALCTDLAELSDESVVVLLDFVGDLAVARFSPTGSLQWGVVLPGVSAPNSNRGLDVAPDDSILVRGYLHAPATSHLLRLDSNGSLLWAQELPGAYALDSVWTPWGSWVLAGFEDGGSALLVEVDLSGNLVRSISYPQVHAFEGVDADTQGLLVTGSLTNGLSHVARLDSTGGSAACTGMDAGSALVPWSVSPGPVTDLSLGTPSQSRTALSETAVDAPLPHAESCSGTVGSGYCTSNTTQNSTGKQGKTSAYGSAELSKNELTLLAYDMPPQKFGYFLAGTGSGVVMPPGSQGRLCLSGKAIARFVPPQPTGAGGWFELPIDVTAIPGNGPILPGETWGFQAWHRDDNPNPTSNFTWSVRVTFQP